MSEKAGKSYRRERQEKKKGGGEKPTEVKDAPKAEAEQIKVDKVVERESVIKPDKQAEETKVNEPKEHVINIEERVN